MPVSGSPMTKHGRRRLPMAAILPHTMSDWREAPRRRLLGVGVSCIWRAVRPDCASASSYERSWAQGVLNTSLRRCPCRSPLSHVYAEDIARRFPCYWLTRLLCCSRRKSSCLLAPACHQICLERRFPSRKHHPRDARRTVPETTFHLPYCGTNYILIATKWLPAPKQLLLHCNH